jgi:hypothetical protein
MYESSVRRLLNIEHFPNDFLREGLRSTQIGFENLVSIWRRLLAPGDFALIEIGGRGPMSTMTRCQQFRAGGT